MQVVYEISPDSRHNFAIMNNQAEMSFYWMKFMILWSRKKPSGRVPALSPSI